MVVLVLHMGFFERETKGRTTILGDPKKRHAPIFALQTTESRPRIDNCILEGEQLTFTLKVKNSHPSRIGRPPISQTSKAYSWVQPRLFHTGSGTWVFDSPS